MAAPLDEQHRIIAIGDIHGCLKTLEALLDKLELRPDDQLVFLGDMIDRGPRSREVIAFLMALAEKRTCHFVMGNHELMLLNYLKGDDPVGWFYNGGKATLDSYGSANGLDLPAEHLAFLRACSPWLETAQWFFAHGGLDPELTIADNLRLYTPEEFSWQRMHMQPFFIENQEFNWNKTLVCAHTPVPEPLLLDRLIAIDTGCVYTRNPLLGNLTAVVLPERRIVQTRNCD